MKNPTSYRPLIYWTFQGVLGSYEGQTHVGPFYEVTAFFRSILDL